MRMPFTRTPTWLLLMPSLAVGVAIYHMDEPAPRDQALGTPSPAVRLAAASAASRPVDAALPEATSSEQAFLESDIGAVAGEDAVPVEASISNVDAAAQASPSLAAQAPLPSVVAGRAKYEPARGAYLGVAVDAEAAKGDPQVLGSLMREWNRKSGRQHALQMAFVQFPSPEGIFPTFDSDPRGWLAPKDFCEAADQNGAAPILTLEPMLNPGQFARNWKAGTPAYEAAASFARGVGEWKKPIFIRWAHEMNGSWYPWAEWNDKNQNFKRDPGEDTGFTARDYRASYRNVAAMFRRYAPNAALVWCPNAGLLGGERRDVFTPFYPGDDVVDWVGLDVYERGWTGPGPGAKLWGGQFAHNLTHDMMDDEKTPANESVNFYRTFAQGKRKPLMLAETSATLSYRTDLDGATRGVMNNAWKSAYWNPAEYGWMQAVYGTSAWQQASGQKLLQPIDTRFPMLKAIVWFQIAKQEWVPVERTRNGRKSYQWFNDTYTDYRIGGGVAKNGESPFGTQELELYRELTAGPYFLQQIQR